MNEFNVEICYPDELADPFYEEDNGISAEFEEEIIKQAIAGNCVNGMHYA